MAGATRNCCHLAALCVHHTATHLITLIMQSRMRGVHACLPVTCHLHFWQNDRDFFTSYCGNTGVERGYRNKSQRRKLALEKNIISPLLTFWSRVRRSNDKHCHANILPSTGHENNTAQPKADDSSTSHFSTFNCWLRAVFVAWYRGIHRKFACCVLS